MHLFLGVCCLLTCIFAPLRGADPSFAEFDRRATAGERLSVVFFGASLTWGANATDQATTSYRAEVARRLEERYPHAHFHYKDGGIGGTGSQLGVFRVDRDVLRWKPDLVFLDFSANDDIGSDDPETLGSYEAIVRRLIGEAKVPVVQVAFPFKWNLDRAQLPNFKRLAAHRTIAETYGCGWGDAVTLIIDRIAAGKANADVLWDTDPVHPGDQGYLLFGEAAWIGFTEAVAAKRACRVPERMLHPSTYATFKRVRIDSLGALPAGWRVGKPSLGGVNYDWQMSRWLDAVSIASNRVDLAGADGKTTRVPRPVASLRFTVKASSVLLLGEGSASSCRFRVLVDGKPVIVKWGATHGTDQFEGNPWKGYGHLVLEVARGLDPSIPHVVGIEPLFAADQDQELRLESICVAGGEATAVLAP